MAGSRGAQDDPTRRTWLAAERTWLAWWRTGIAAGALAVAVGRLLPPLTHGARWPFRVLGVGYALVSMLVFVVGAVRQGRVAAALRRGGYSELSPALVHWLTALAVLLTLGATLLVLISF